MLVIALVQHTPDLGPLALPVLLYIGPDVFLPLTSALAAIGGIILLFWQRIVGLVGRLLGRSSKRTAGEPPSSGSGD